MIFIDITSNEEVGGVCCAGPMSVASSSKLLLFPFPVVEMGQKEFSMVKVA